MAKKKSVAGVRLIRGEDIVDSFHPVFWMFIHHYFGASALIIISIYLYFGRVVELNEFMGLITFSTILIIGVLWFIIAVIMKFSEIIITTNKRVIHKKGILSRDVSDADMDKIHNLKIDQNFIESILNYGELSVDTAGSEGYELVIKGVPSVNKKHAIIKHVMESDIDASKEHEKRVSAEKTLEEKKKEIKRLEREIKEMDNKLSDYKNLEKKMSEDIKKEQELLKKIKEKKQ